MKKPSKDIVLVLVTTANQRQALRISEMSVTSRLAACANILPGVKSIFRWKGKITRGKEVLLILKTTKARFRPLEKLIKTLHSYEVPEIIAIAIQSGSQQYLEWVLSETNN